MLAKEQCVACRSDSPRVIAEEENQLLSEIPEWEIVDINDVRKLRRTYRLADWMAVVQLSNRIADMAQSEDHHPTMTIAWGRLTVTWWTHAISGLHRNDFVMAARSDDAFAQV